MGVSQYLRARQIAEELGLSVRTIRRWLADGTLPSVRLGGARLVAEVDLLRLVQPGEASELPDEFYETKPAESEAS